MFKSFWLQFHLFTFTFDLQDEISIDLFAVMLGKGGVKFDGSLFMFYRELEPFHDPVSHHYDWDFLFLRQFFK